MTQTITPLRRRLLDDMWLCNMAAGTCRTYVRSKADFRGWPVRPGGVDRAARPG